jgi:hypothetical protein
VSLLGSEIDQIRQEAKATLYDAAADGRLDKFVKTGGASVEVDQLRQAAKATLYNAAVNGRLEKIVETRRRDNWCLTPSVGTWLSHLVTGQEKTSMMNQGSKEAVLETLECMQQVPEVQFRQMPIRRNWCLTPSVGTWLSHAVPTKSRASDDKISEEARLNTMGILLSAASDGRLDAIMQSVRQPKREAPADVDEIRQAAKATLYDPAADGRLDKFVKTRGASEEVDQLRQAAKATLYNAAVTGRLENIMENRLQTKQSPAPAVPKWCQAPSVGTWVSHRMESESSPIEAERKEQKSATDATPAIQQFVQEEAQQKFVHSVEDMSDENFEAALARLNSAGEAEQRMEEAATTSKGTPIANFKSTTRGILLVAI